MKQHKVLRSNENFKFSLSSHKDHVKTILRKIAEALQYDFYKFSYYDLGNDYYGVTNFKAKTVLINHKKPLAYRIITIGHESIHVWINELSKGLKSRLLPSFANAFLDLIDYYLTDFKLFYEASIQEIGFIKSSKDLLDRYDFFYERAMSKQWWNRYKKRGKSPFSGNGKNLWGNWVKEFIRRRLS